ncbi:hypothetical protein N8955_00205 [bacterium]|nr:hypothetical protein [bacterium]MDA9225060.1 hypothetical protein [bacterium]
MGKDKKEFDMTDIDSDISSKWKPSEGIDWDLIQRMRFMNADAEIAPGDSYVDVNTVGAELKVRTSTSGDDDSLMNIIYGNKD